MRFAYFITLHKQQCIISKHTECVIETNCISEQIQIHKKRISQSASYN